MPISKRKLLTISANCVGGAGVIALTIPFVQSLLPTGGTRVVNTPLNVDFSGLSPGKQMTMAWRKMPVYIKTDRPHVERFK